MALKFNCNLALDGVTKTATVDSSGQFTGDAIGSMILTQAKGV
jgi:hypothetical protein